MASIFQLFLDCPCQSRSMESGKTGRTNGRSKGGQYEYEEYTPAQESVLKASFRKSSYPKTNEIAALVNLIGTKSAQIKVIS